MQIFIKNRRPRARSLFNYWQLVAFIVVVGVYQISVFNYYFAAGKLGNAHPPSPDSSPPASENNGESIASGKNHRKETDVIVYLAQFGNHSSYGAQSDADGKAITGLSKLNKSLELLYSNYASRFPADVIIFYDRVNAPDANTMAELQRNRPHLQFRSLDGKWWSLPHGLQAWEHMTWSRPAFSIGYRLMMRWYAYLIWFYLDDEGYTHCMRLDDDSYILSRIDYDLFDYMRDNKKRYAFVQPVFEPGGDDFDALVDKHLAEHPVATSRELIDSYERDRGVGFYNNFFMADVSFFLSPPAAALLRAIDESKLIFTRRTGDLVIQSTVVRLFLPPEQVHWFRDFTYEHMTLCRRDKCGYGVPRGCPQNGGVSRGSGYTDAGWRKFASEEVRNRFRDNPKKCSVPINQYFVGAEDVRLCSRLQSRCGFYLESVSGANGTADNSNWLGKLLQDGEITPNKIV